MIARGNSTALRRDKMKKVILCVLAVLAGAVSTSAVAKNVKAIARDGAGIDGLWW
jgi:hypothetical protein